MNDTVHHNGWRIHRCNYGALMTARCYPLTFNASLRYAFLISSADASFATPNVLYSLSVSACVVRFKARANFMNLPCSRVNPYRSRIAFGRHVSHTTSQHGTNRLVCARRASPAATRHPAIEKWHAPEEHLVGVDLLTMRMNRMFRHVAQCEKNACTNYLRSNATR